jgi:pimeloyl-ACP methyl ester carboxylesterase
MSGRGQISTVKSGGVSIEIERRGSGRPLLLLCGEEQLELEAGFIDELAKNFEVILPSPAGFGHSDRPDWVSNVDDLSYMMLDVMDALSLKDVTIVGFSLGGWIAVEMASKNTSNISRLVLVDAYGVKVGGPFDRDIMDIWTSHPSAVAAAKWADAEKGKRDFSQMNDDQLTIVARQRLHRVNVPTLLIWGDKDAITSPAYGEAYAKLIPGAKFSLVPGAGHYPHIEKPDAFLSVLKPFIA